jgi:CRISPR-associated protein Cmr1
MLDKSYQKVVMEVRIKTCTPIWTGGIEAGKCDRIHETGILGSLRWWMEVLVRGMGGQVCDPTAEKSEERSGLNPEKFNAKKYCELQDEVERRKYLRDAGLCDVSQIFGATGWKRQFRLEVIIDNTKPDKKVSSEIKLKSYQYQYKNKNGETKTATGTPEWYFPKNSQDKPRGGEFTIKIERLNPNFKPEIIAALIQFIADYSALGARPQMGFGVIKIEGDRIDTRHLCKWLIDTAGNANNQQLENYLYLPSLKNIFLAQIKPKDSNSSFTEQDTFNLKHDLRNCFRAKAGKPDNLRQLRHFIMGVAPKDSDNDSTSKSKEASKIKISRPYDNEKLIRVWGWIPQKSEFYKNGWDREKIVDKIHKHLADNYQIPTWRAQKNQDNPEAFLSSLLGLQEDSDAI